MAMVLVMTKGLIHQPMIQMVAMQIMTTGARRRVHHRNRPHPGKGTLRVVTMLPAIAAMHTNQTGIIEAVQVRGMITQDIAVGTDSLPLLPTDLGQQAQALRQAVRPAVVLP